MNYTYEMFNIMLNSSHKLRVLDDKRFAFLVRLGFSNEDINKKIEQSYGSDNRAVIENVDTLIDLQKQL